MTIGTTSGNRISRVRGVGRLTEADRIGARQLRMLRTAPPPCAETAVPSPEPVPEPVAQPAPQTAVPHPHTMAGWLDLAVTGAAVLSNSRNLRHDLSRQPDSISVVPLTLPHLRAGRAEFARAACSFGWYQQPIRLPNTALRQAG